MRTFIGFLVVVTFLGIAPSHAQTLIDAWYYTGVSDGTAINGGPGTGSVSNDLPESAWESTWKAGGIPGNVNIVSNEAQRWEGSYVAGTITTNDSAFKNIAPSSFANAVGGIYQWSYDILSADFANTAASNGSANAMYIIRGKSGTTGAYDCGLRIRYEGGLDVTNVFTVNGTPISTNIYADADQIQILMSSADLSGWTVLTNFAGSTIADLNLRMLYDINVKTNAAYLTVGAGSEVLLYGGTMQADWNLAEMRQGFQSGNGGNSWQPGDVLVIDNIELYQIEDAPLPETGLVDLWTYDGLTNGAPLSAAVSTGLVGGVSFADNTIATVSNEMLRLARPVPVVAGMFRTRAPSLFLGTTVGVFDMSYDVPYMDFSNTQAAGTNANFGFEVRDTPVNTSIGATINYNGATDRIELQFRDASGTEVVRTFPGAVLSNLTIRVVFNLDDAGNAGSVHYYYTYQGVEVAATYNGTVPSGFELDEYRLRAQVTNGGNGWQPGDVALMDNLKFEKIAAMPALPVYADKVIYEMDDPNGTLLNELDQTGTDGGQFQGTDPNITANGLGSLVFTGDGTNEVTRKHFTDIIYQEGLHRLEFAFDDWNLDATEDSSSLKFGLTDDTGSNTVQFGIDVNTNNATVRFRAAANNGGDAGQDFYDHAGYVASTGVVLRIDVNLDAGIYSASWRYDNATDFTDVVVGGSVGPLANVAEIRLSVNAADTVGFDPTDYVNVDYLRYSTTSAETLPTPEEYYAFWLDDYPGLGASTNLFDNNDGDPYINLWEYAFNGNPTVGEPIAFAPAVQDVIEIGGTNYIDYVYTRWKQPGNRGLSYYIQLNSDLVTGTWTNDTSKYEVLPGGTVDVDFWAVTNRINISNDDQLFIRTGVSATFGP